MSPYLFVDHQYNYIVKSFHSTAIILLISLNPYKQLCAASQKKQGIQYNVIWIVDCWLKLIINVWKQMAIDFQPKTLLFLFSVITIQKVYCSHFSHSFDLLYPYCQNDKHFISLLQSITYNTINQFIIISFSQVGSDEQHHHQYTPQKDKRVRKDAGIDARKLSFLVTWYQFIELACQPPTCDKQALELELLPLMLPYIAYSRALIVKRDFLASFCSYSCETFYLCCLAFFNKVNIDQLVPNQEKLVIKLSLYLLEYFLICSIFRQMTQNSLEALTSCPIIFFFPRFPDANAQYVFVKLNKLLQRINKTEVRNPSIVISKQPINFVASTRNEPLLVGLQFRLFSLFHPCFYGTSLQFKPTRVRIGFVQLLEDKIVSSIFSSNEEVPGSYQIVKVISTCLCNARVYLGCILEVFMVDLESVTSEIFFSATYQQKHRCKVMASELIAIPFMEIALIYKTDEVFDYEQLEHTSHPFHELFAFCFGVFGYKCFSQQKQYWITAYDVIQLIFYLFIPSRKIFVYFWQTDQCVSDMNPQPLPHAYNKVIRRNSLQTLQHPRISAL